ncbi:MAG: IS1595 family transposase [Cytophaga sp.]|uniref:IS1595 family transposase n=1 Tax=Cytophaga sp. TaxID=29535 RepID=UPI003F7F58B4
MKLLDFIKKFPDEQSCRLYLKNKREREGITCKCCKGTKHYWFEKQGLWKCAKCGSRTSLRAGTFMEQSKLPMHYWFVAMHLISTTKKSFSTLELQKQLGHKYFEPILDMRKKIDVMMGKRDAQYKLKGRIEMDEGFFEVVNMDMKGQKLKRGRGSQRQCAVLVMVESTPLTTEEKENKKNKFRPDRKVGHVKMVVLDNTSKKSINYEVRNAVEPTSTIDSDAWKGYADLLDVVENHNKEVIPKKQAHKKLPWVHTFISNCKRLLLGVHHSIRKEYLQNYLNEYVYKLNRRYLEDEDIFDRLLVAGVSGNWNK